MGSQHIPQVSNSSSLYPISFALNFGLLIYISNPKEEINISILGLFKACLIFIFVMDQSKMPITKPKKKTLGGSHN